VADELLGADIPRAIERKSTAGIARNLKGSQTCRAEKVAQYADRIVAGTAVESLESRPAKGNRC
jgi:hypothetical protein